MRAVGEELVAMENEEIKTSSELLEATMQGVVGPKKNWKDKLGDGEVTFSILRKLADSATYETRERQAALGRGGLGGECACQDQARRALWTGTRPP